MNEYAIGELVPFEEKGARCGEFRVIGHDEDAEHGRYVRLEVHSLAATYAGGLQVGNVLVVPANAPLSSLKLVPRRNAA